MIQFILMLFSLAFSNNNANTVTANDNNPITITSQTQSGPTDPTDDTGGETTQTPPKK